MSNQELFKQLGIKWKELDTSEKSIWEQRAREENKSKEKYVDNNTTEPSNNVNEVSCPFCERKYWGNDSLKIHLIENHGSKPKNSGALDNENVTKNQGRLHQYKVCHKLINSEKDLNNHMLNEHLLVGDNITNEIETIEDSIPENVIDSNTDDLNNHMVNEYLPVDNNIPDETETMKDSVTIKVIN